MPSVRVRENEYFDAALRRFKRACEKAGVLTELRRREFYEKPTQERKRKKAAAVKRHMKRSHPRRHGGRRGARPPAPTRGSASVPYVDVAQGPHHRGHEGRDARQRRSASAPSA